MRNSRIEREAATNDQVTALTHGDQLLVSFGAASVTTDKRQRYHGREAGRRRVATSAKSHPMKQTLVGARYGI